MRQFLPVAVSSVGKAGRSSRPHLLASQVTRAHLQLWAAACLRIKGGRRGGAVAVLPTGPAEKRVRSCRAVPALSSLWLRFKLRAVTSRDLVRSLLLWVVCVCLPGTEMRGKRWGHADGRGKNPVLGLQTLLKCPHRHVLSSSFDQILFSGKATRQ